MRCGLIDEDSTTHYHGKVTLRSAACANVSGAPLWARTGRVLLCLGPVLWADRAQAFCRTTTCDARGLDSEECALDEARCSTAGIPLAWRRHCFGFGATEQGSATSGITAAETQATVLEAITAWNSVTCEGGSPALSIVLQPLIRCAVAEYNPTGPNASAVVWVDQNWDHSLAIVALTTVTFTPSTGEIVGADIELNSEDYQFTTGDVGFGMDLQSTITHELGHVLGLSHSDDPGATMRRVQMPGDTELRNLGTDDVAGLCSVYPPATVLAPCDPNFDFSPRCGGNVIGGCGVSPGATARRRDWGPEGFLYTALGAWVFGRRRRRRRHSREPRSGAGTGEPGGCSTPRSARGCPGDAAGGTRPL